MVCVLLCRRARPVRWLGRRSRRVRRKQKRREPPLVMQLGLMRPHLPSHPPRSGHCGRRPRSVTPCPRFRQLFHRSFSQELQVAKLKSEAPASDEEEAPVVASKVRLCCVPHDCFPVLCHELAAFLLFGVCPACVTPGIAFCRDEAVTPAAEVAPSARTTRWPFVVQRSSWSLRKAC